MMAEKSKSEDRRVHRVETRTSTYQYYEYRGKRFEKDNSTPSGYWGRYRVGSFGGRRFGYLWEVKQYIDKLVEEAE